MLEYELHENVIQQYLNNELPKKSEINLQEIAKELIERLQAAVEIDNATGTHKKNWKLPSRLSMPEIDIVLRHIYTIKKISLTDDTITSDNYILAIYNEDETKGPTGIYIVDDNFINSMIYDLNPTLTVSNVKDIRALMYTRVPVAKLTKDKNLVPVNNGIFDQKTKKRVFLYDTYPLTPLKGLVHAE